MATKKKVTPWEERPILGVWNVWRFVRNYAFSKGVIDFDQDAEAYAAMVTGKADKLVEIVKARAKALGMKATDERIKFKNAKKNDGTRLSTAEAEKKPGFFEYVEKEYYIAVARNEQLRRAKRAKKSKVKK